MFGACFTILAKVAIIVFSVILILGVIQDASNEPYQMNSASIDFSKKIDDIAPFLAETDKSNVKFEIAFGMYDLNSLEV